MNAYWEDYNPLMISLMPSRRSCVFLDLHAEKNIIEFQLSRELFADPLRAACKQPDNQKDLLVGIDAYTAHFIQQGKPMQEDFIKRIEHEKPA